MEPMIEIQEANAQAAAIRDIYAQLRAIGNSNNRTPLLRQAEQYADALSQSLRLVAANTSGVTLDAETLVALQELGSTMEALMVQEREYRISAGGDEIPLPREA